MPSAPEVSEDDVERLHVIAGAQVDAAYAHRFDVMG